MKLKKIFLNIEKQRGNRRCIGVINCKQHYSCQIDVESIEQDYGRCMRVLAGMLETKKEHYIHCPYSIYMYVVHLAFPAHPS